MLAARRRAHLPASSSRLVAHLLTEGLAPAPVAGLLLLIVAWHSAASFADALLWGVISVVCAAVIPMAYIVRAFADGDLLIDTCVCARSGHCPCWSV